MVKKELDCAINVISVEYKQRPFSPFRVEFLLGQAIFVRLLSSFTPKPIAEIFTRLKLKSYRL